MVGGFILEYFVDGVYNDAFADFFVNVMKSFHMQENTAIDLYWHLIGHNKTFFMLLGFLGLFAIFFYVSISKMTKFLHQVEDGIENIVSDSTEPVYLITELRPIEDRLNEIKMTIKRQEFEAMESERKKNDFVVFLAHDLKTPLTSIVAYLSILETRPDMSDEERAKYTHISLEKAIRLGELINEFFEITRFNLQDIVLDLSELDLSMMLEQLADELYGVLREKNLTCSVHIEETLMVYGDADKLARVFDNLLRNAIAYCYANSAIHIKAKEVNGCIEVIFINEGKRIPQEQLISIFEKFYRVDGARSSMTGGAGLGLAISKEIVELHKGTIRAESDDDNTRFIVTLPKVKITDKK